MVQKTLLDRLKEQTISVNRIILINTEQGYFDTLIAGTNFWQRYKNITVKHISKREFDHGYTRRRAVAESDADYFVMMTDDAIPADDCLIENPGISTYDMCVADYQFLLHKLRIVTYGTDYKVEFTCPYCGSQASEVINLADILVKGYNPSIKKYLEFDLPKTNKHAKIRMQTPRLIDAANVKAKQFKKMSPDFSGDPAFIFTLESLIETIDGKPLDQTRVIETIRNMPMADVNTILNQTAKFNEGMGLDCLVTYVCDTCGLSHTGMFRQTAEFFRPTSN